MEKAIVLIIILSFFSLPLIAALVYCPELWMLGLGPGIMVIGMIAAVDSEGIG